MLPQKAITGARTPTRDAISQFLKHAQRYATTTQRLYRDTLYRFCEQVPDFIGEIRAEHIDRYILSRKISNNSRNTELISIKSFFRYLADYHNIENVAAKVKNLRREPSKQIVISYNSLRKILKFASEKQRCVILFLAFTGLRASEFSSLTPNSISPDGKFITIIGKGRKRRSIPLNDTCRKCWPGIFYKNWTKDKLAWVCKRLAQKSGIEFSPHSLRHFFVTELVKRGVPIAIVSKLAGHASVETTIKVYTHLFTQDFEGVTDILDI